MHSTQHVHTHKHAHTQHTHTHNTHTHTHTHTHTTKTGRGLSKHTNIYNTIHTWWPPILPSRSLLNVKTLLPGHLVQPEELNAFLSVRVGVLLPGDEEVAVEQHEGPIGGKVRDRLHDVPWVLKPGETGKAPKLDSHCTQAWMGMGMEICLWKWILNENKHGMDVRVIACPPDYSWGYFSYQSSVPCFKCH